MQNGESFYSKNSLSQLAPSTMVYENGMGVLPIFHSASSFEHQLQFDSFELPTFSYEHKDLVVSMIEGNKEVLGYDAG